MKKNFPHRLRAFSLIEVSIVLIIIGLITTAVFKGQDLIESARAQATLEELNRIKLSVLTYRDHYGQWPGNDTKAHLRFGSGVNSGDGRGLIHGAECMQAWAHLKAAGLVDSGEPPASKLGGYITFLSNPSSRYPGNWLALSMASDRLMAALTPKQAMLLKSKAGESLPEEGHLIVQSAPGQSLAACHNGQAFNLQNKAQACTILMKLQ
ncbi:type II secretion system protein [Candidatus Odyssella acanthamoebae]|uniref:type II secretion system protein n=1 Tax=Candidatus Odyssella acanthamoebae TaxID=91604 RepID=UPI0012EB9BF0|nr:prepilin-type N-terminal cleavage/methylation domain-containing protein [Candidatus Paracaedibacter acanthamoebae]